MSKLCEIDKNFLPRTVDIPANTEFYNVKENLFCLFGLIADSRFRRMPEEIAVSINQGTYELHTNTSGGRLRFATDSPYLVLTAKMPLKHPAPHVSKTGCSSFDIYSDGRFVDIFIPPMEAEGAFSGVCPLGDGRLKNYTLNFPLYDDVEELIIGVKKGSVFKEADYFKTTKKVVFYGSSITQGGCVSRPGIAYTNQIANSLDCDIINLGFSGSALGELAMAEYIVGIEHDIFVMDYDHNAPTLEHLAKTHEPFFKRYRYLRPHTPVVIISAPNMHFGGEEWRCRRDTVRKTFENAVESGDKNVYFIDGETLWGKEWDVCTVEGIHPNDIGHYEMAKRITPVIEKLINR